MEESQIEKIFLRFSPITLPYFTGRRLELDSMREKLETPSFNGDDSPSRFVVWGMAGVGKTQFVHRYLKEIMEQKTEEKTKEESDEKTDKQTPGFNILWLKASSDENLNKSIELALYDIYPTNSSLILHAVKESVHGLKLKKWLEFDCIQFSSYILIIDDVRQQTLLQARNLIPTRSGTSRVIITTRSRIIAEALTPANDRERCCELKVFDLDTAEDMFYQISKVEKGAMKERVDDVVESVGRLPLAIEIAANRAKLWGVDPVWRKRRNALEWTDDESYYDDHQHYRDKKKRVLKYAFDHFWDSVAKNTTPEANLFRDLSFFDSHSISTSLLDKNPDQHQGFSFRQIFGKKREEEWTPSSWMDSIIKLERTALITQQSKGASKALCMHQLLQALNRYQLISDKNFEKHLERGANMLQQAVLAAHDQFQHTQSSALCEEIIRHTQSILAFMKEFKTLPLRAKKLQPILLDIRDSVVELFWRKGQYRDALDTARETFKTRKILLGTGHRDFLRSLNMSIKAELHQGHYIEAEFLIKQAFDEYQMRDRSSEPNSYQRGDYLSCLDNFAVMLRCKGEFGKAESESFKAWKGWKKVKGATDRHTLRSLTNLALTLQSHGYYDKAANRSRQALEGLDSKQNLLGDDDLDTLTSRACHGFALYHQGLYALAEAETERALNGRSKTLGEKHPDTLSSLQDYATIRQAQGDYPSAFRKTKEVLRHREEVLGKDHPDTIASLDHLASIYLCQGKYQLAETAAKRAFAQGLEVFPEEHPALSASMRSFARVRRCQGYFQEAREIYEGVYESRKERLRPEHPDTLASSTDIAWGLSIQGQYTEAEDIYQEVYRRQCEVLGENHPQTLATLSSLASIHLKLGRYEEAQNAAELAWMSQEEYLGVIHPDTLTSMHIYAIILRHQRWDEDAASLAKSVVEERERVLGLKHPDTITSRNSYASTLASLGQYEEAESLCKDGLDQRRKLLKEDHPDIVGSLNTYSELLQCQNKDAMTQTRDALLATQNLEDDRPERLVSRYNYGLALCQEGQLSEAYEEIEGVLNIQQRVLQNDHPDTLSSYHQLGVILLKSGRYEEARVKLEKAFQGRKICLRREHPDTLATLSFYCLVVAQQDGIPAAKDTISSELGVAEVNLGLRRIVSLKDLPNYRSISYHTRDQAAEALTKIRIAWRKYALHRRSDHLKVKLAVTLLKQGEGEEAEQTLLSMKSHPDTSTLLRLSYLQQGKLAEAQAIL